MATDHHKTENKFQCGKCFISLRAAGFIRGMYRISTLRASWAVLVAFLDNLALGCYPAFSCVLENSTLENSRLGDFPSWNFTLTSSADGRSSQPRVAP